MSVVFCVVVLLLGIEEYGKHTTEKQQQQLSFAESYCGEGTLFDAVKQQCIAHRIEKEYSFSLDTRKYDIELGIDKLLSFRHGALVLGGLGPHMAFSKIFNLKT